MDHSEVLDILRPQWRAADGAKSTGELLWTHHYTVWSVGRKLARLAPSIDAPEARLLELACLTHDIGQRDAECQRRLRDGQAPGDHKLDLDQVTSYFRRDLADTIPVSDADLAQIAEIARTHHSVSQADIRAQQFDRAGLLGRLLITSDWIGSMDEPDFDTLARLQALYAGRLDFSYFQFSRFPSPTSFLVVRVALKHYQQRGWEPLIVVPQGAVFVATAGANRPLRSDVAALVEREVIRESLALQASVPTGYTGDFLTLLSKEYPDLFLTGNAERIRVVQGAATGSGLPACGDLAGLVKIGFFAGLLHFREFDEYDADAQLLLDLFRDVLHLAADGHELGALHRRQALAHVSQLKRIIFARRRIGGGRPFTADAIAGGDKLGRGAALLQQFKTLGRLGQVFDF